MKRNGYLFIILFLYTTPILGIGKDNPDSLQAVRECLSPLFAFGEKSYANPALQPYARQFSLSSLRLSGEYKNEKEAVIVQQGSGYRRFTEGFTVNGTVSNSFRTWAYPKCIKCWD